MKNVDAKRLFEHQIRDDEEIVAVYEAGKGYIPRKFFSPDWLPHGLMLLFPPFLAAAFVSSIFWFPIFGFLSKKNFFVCLTDSRLIVRRGIAGVHFNEFDIENFSNIRTGQSVYEKRDPNNCHIEIERTSFHMMQNGMQIPQTVKLATVKNGFDLAKKISSAKKNNKNVVVELKK